MPWKECLVMEERYRFVVRLLAGEEMSSLCREYGISRKTGYKIFDRYKDEGMITIAARSRGPFRYGNQLPEQVDVSTQTIALRQNRCSVFNPQATTHWPSC